MYREAAEVLGKQLGTYRPKTAIILGTGLGSFAEGIEDAVRIPYSMVPGMPLSKAPGHKGEFVAGRVGGLDVIMMQGRVHFYGGYSMQELAVPIHILRALGVDTLLVTNASGGINPAFCPGDLVLLRDHIKLDLDSPLRGENDPALGSRFFDMTEAYTPALAELAHQAAAAAAVELKEGVYAYMGGPQFETPAEIRMLRMFGADLVGMSTVPEVIAAVHCGMRILAVSCVTNMAAGIQGGGLNQAVIDESERNAAGRFRRLMTEVCRRLAIENTDR